MRGTFKRYAAAEVGYYLARRLDAMRRYPAALTVVELFVWERAYRNHRLLVS